MNNREQRLVNAGVSAIAFVSSLKRPPSRVTEAAKRVEEAVDAARAATVKQNVARDSRKRPRQSVIGAKTILLRKHLDPMAADGLEMFAGLPGIEDSLKLPRIKDAPEKHLEAAKRIRRVAEQHEQELITACHYDENFVESFDAAVRDLEAAARVERGSGRAKYTRATGDVKEVIARLRRALNTLDTRIVAAYLGDRHLLKRWRKESRVPPKMGRPKTRRTGLDRHDRAWV